MRPARWSFDSSHDLHLAGIQIDYDGSLFLAFMMLMLTIVMQIAPILAPIVAVLVTVMMVLVQVSAVFVQIVVSLVLVGVLARRDTTVPSATRDIGRSVPPAMPS